MGRFLRCLLVTLLGLVAYVLGVATRDTAIYRATDYWCRGGRCGFDETRDREPVDCARFGPDAQRSAVLLTGGQSNAANYGQLPIAPRDAVFNFSWFDGRCYRARDPLLGPDGNGGSVWTRLGDLLVSRKQYDQVLIVPIAVGGSALRRWPPGGDLHSRVVDAKLRLDAAGIRITHVLWHQGERDAELDTPADEYSARFGAFVSGLRELGIDAPVYAAIASACNGPGRESIRAAQRALPERFPGVHAGPDTDTLDRFEYRYDGCHFSDAGLDAHARLWLDAAWPEAVR
jgi:hypothetical protein